MRNASVGCGSYLLKHAVYYREYQSGTWKENSAVKTAYKFGSGFTVQW